MTADFTKLPRVPLATLPTPLTDAPGLRKALGGAARCPRILLKRDDLTGLALGGNKARKLEFLIGDARRQGATTVVTTGAVQSNHARMTAAAARVAGLGVTLVLTTQEPNPPCQGNYLLDRMFGARVHLIAAGPDPKLAVAPDEDAQVRAVVDELRAEGEHPYRDSGRRIERRRRARLRCRNQRTGRAARRDGAVADAPVLRQRFQGHAGRARARVAPVRHRPIACSV